MDRILELLARIGDLTQDELNELSGLIEAEVDAVAAEEPTADTADALTALADAHDQVVAEQGRRDEEQDAIATRHAEQLARLRPAEDGAGEGEEGAEGAEAGEGDEGAEGGEPAEGTEGAEPIAASAQPARPTLADIARRRPANRAPVHRDNSAAGAALVAAGGPNAGQRFGNMRDLALAFEQRRRTMGQASGGGDGEQLVVASSHRDYPEARQLTSDPEVNAERIEEAVRAGLEPQALVAAGGLCAPIENVYDVEVIGVTDRPIRDSLPSFQAARGGISLRPAQQFQDLDASVGEWTLATDTTPGGATKAVLEVVCAAFQNFFVGAVTVGLKFHNIAARTDPEGTAANIAASEIALARFAENRLFLQMVGLSKTVTAAAVKSVTRDMLHYLDRSIAYYRSRHRLNDNIPLRFWLPRWVKDFMRGDMVLSGPGTPGVLALSDAQINEFFAVRGVSVTWHLDGRLADLAASAPAPAVAKQTYATVANNGVIPPFPAQIEGILAREGDFLFLDSGDLDLGIVRDSTLNATNAYQTFAEEFNGVAFRGIESLRVVASFTATGDSEIGS